MSFPLIIGAALVVAAFAISRYARRFRQKRPGLDARAAADAGSAIDAFWSWWQTAAPRLAADIDAGRAALIADEVTARVKAIDSRLGWETGPGLKGARHHFALSPEGDVEVRVLTERWLARAPRADESWEYHPARQASPLATSSSLELDGVTIDFPRLTAGIRTDADRKVVHVLFHHPAFGALDERGQLRAAFLALDELFGEDDVERWIGAVKTSREPPPDGKPLAELVASVEALRKSTAGDEFALLRGKTPKGDALVATVNLGLKRVDHLLMDQSLTISFPLREPTPAGLTTAEESAELNALEDDLMSVLGHDAVYIGHETGGGSRILYFHAATMGPAEARAREWASGHPDRTVIVAAEYDPRWDVFRRW